MTNYEQLLSRLMREDKLKEYDVVNLDYGNYCYKHNIDPTIKNNIAHTLTTRCNMFVVLKENRL